MSRGIQRHKFTAKCPIKNCKYTSKIPYTNNNIDNTNSVHSKTCPIHRQPLIKI